MNRKPIIAGFTILLAMIMVQLLWHILLGLHNPISDSLRNWYLTVGNLKFRKAPVSDVVDGILPGFTAGAAFVFFGKPRSFIAMGCFGIVCATILGCIQFIYPQVITYELWWLDRKLGNPLTVVAFFALSGGMFSIVPSFGYFGSKTRQQ